MKKVGCVTFHASHNYGSVLQAYALQEFIKEKFKNIDYKIINLRTKRQKKMYSVFPDNSSLKYKFFVLLNFVALKRKYNRFEKFINANLAVTKEFDDEYISESNFDFDYYISGGDQIWNLAPVDFSWLYFLPFVKKNKKISYSVSLGPKSYDFNDEDRLKIGKYINSYSFLSLREKESIAQLGRITEKSIQQNIDPVLLLNKTTWLKLIGKRLVKRAYIFMYILDGDLQAYSFAKRLSRLTKKKVIVTKPICKKDFFNYYSNHFDCGPIEFLNYIYYSDCVISTSFHGCVFASVFERPLITFNAEKDNRRKYFLEKYGLNDRNIKESISDKEIEKLLTNINYKKFNLEIQKERIKSFEYLKNAFDE